MTPWHRARDHERTAWFDGLPLWLRIVVAIVAVILVLYVASDW